jgi:hypothetical protein
MNFTEFVSVFPILYPKIETAGFTAELSRGGKYGFSFLFYQGLVPFSPEMSHETRVSFKSRGFRINIG